MKTYQAVIKGGKAPYYSIYGDGKCHALGGGTSKASARAQFVADWSGNGWPRPQVLRVRLCRHKAKRRNWDRLARQAQAWAETYDPGEPDPPELDEHWAPAWYGGRDD